MRKTYRILADIIAIEVVIQAMALAFGEFGFNKWINDGNSFDKKVFDDRSADFTGVVGFPIHGINGEIVIPLLGLILLIVSFFAKVPGGIKWAALVVVAIAAQVALGVTAGDVPALGPLHGLNAFVLFSIAILAARKAKPASLEPTATSGV